MDDNAVRKAEAVKFVKNTLGCNCPEEVFKQVEVRIGEQASSGILLERWISVGGRLLVHVFNAGKGNISKKTLFELLEAGIAERDAHGFNRFRLVLACEDTSICDEQALRALYPSTDLLELKAHVGLDDKVHVHIISENILV